MTPPRVPRTEHVSLKLSIVIPAYNEEALLGRCLEAVLREVRRARCEAEIVVVNNASTDRTRAIAESYPGVRVIDEPIRGIVHARHRGLVGTTGELVANIDADTEMPAGWTDRVLAEFARDPKLVALSGPVVFDGLPAWQSALVRLSYVAAYPFFAVASNLLGLASVIQGGNFAFRRSAWLAAGGYDRSIDFYGEDTDVARRLRRFGRVKWTFALPMLASGRRFAADGLLATGARYAVNFLSMTLLGRPVTRTHTDVRAPLRPPEADPERRH